ncbi:MAG: MBL fold metallo-hydrolase [Actinomycetota bacterium]|nr:MBL fold metallo-hydrolase [Actinomycetota bacterium]
MTAYRLLNRRMAIAEMGKAGLAIAVFGAAACSDETADPDADSTDPAVGSSAPPTSTTAPETATTTAVGSSFERVDLGFVSAYILYRAGEAALVDTGVEGSEGDIEAALAAIGLGWDAVGHVIVTHKHPDHQGGLGAIVALAPIAQVYAGADDIPAMDTVASPISVGDGERVFDLEIIETPGHTAGHISVLDTVAGILVTGDALNGVASGGGGVAGPDSGFSEDMTAAIESVAKLAGFTYEVALFGHGPPVLVGASGMVNALATSLG